jgi:predicted ester cyclase
LEAVRKHYEQLFKAAPDLAIEVLNRYVTDDAVILECEIRGSHLGWWRGLPPTGRRLRFPLCAVYTFTEGISSPESGSTTTIELRCSTSSGSCMTRRRRSGGR